MRERPLERVDQLPHLHRLASVLRKGQIEGERERECERERVCVSGREGGRVGGTERESAYWSALTSSPTSTVLRACEGKVRERERERVCVCVCEREGGREGGSEREREKESPPERFCEPPHLYRPASKRDQTVLRKDQRARVRDLS